MPDFDLSLSSDDFAGDQGTGGSGYSSGGADHRKFRAADRTKRELTGQVDYILWQADDGTAAIARLRTGEVVQGPLDETDSDLEVGAAYRFLGKWVNHVKHGDQFKFDTYVRDTPANQQGVMRYLADMAPGVGRVKAARLWELFGAEAVTVLRTDPVRVAGAGLLTLEKAQQAAAELEKSSALEKTKIDLFTLFAGRGFPGKCLTRCIDAWGAKAAERVRRNPFALLVGVMNTRNGSSGFGTFIEFPGAGFKRCDKMFIDLGGKPDSLKRQMLCAWDSLRQDNNGHTWFRTLEVRKRIESYCRGPGINPAKALEMGVRGGWLSVMNDPAHPQIQWVAEAEKAENERKVADAIRRLLKNCVVRWPTPADMPPGALSAHQAEKTAIALSRAVGILTGTPGTGKTYTAAAVIAELVRKWGSTIGVCAPTGKAAVRLTANLHKYGVGVEATTIHRTLGISRNGHDGKGWGFVYNETNPLPYQFLVVDEFSMCDTDLAASLFSACADGAHVLIIGDPYQLAPVGHGAPLRDLIAAGVPCGELSEIRRNAGLIVQACKQIKDGKRFDTCDRYDAEAGLNLKHVETRDDEHGLEVLRAMLRQFGVSKKFDPVWETQVLVAVNERGGMSRVKLNEILQAELNPTGKQVEGNPFRVEDKIICLKNGWCPIVEPARADSFGPTKEDLELGWWQPSGGDFEAYIANGEIGRVLAVDSRATITRFDGPERIIKIAMGRQTKEEKEAAAKEEKGRGCNFDLAYSVTTHKAQGSEWPCVVVVIDENAGFVACREHIYTSISRAGKLGILLGKRAVLEKQARRATLRTRKTFLRELLREGMGAP